MTHHLHLKPEDPESESEEAGEEESLVTNLAHSDADLVQADLVRMHQSSAQEITAEEIELHQSLAARVQATRITTHESALGLVNAAEVQAINTGIGGVHGENVSVDGFAGAVIAGKAELGNTIAGLVAADQVQGERIETFLLLARHVDGDVKTIVDTRTALLGGMVGGLFAGMIFLLGQALFRRRDD